MRAFECTGTKARELVNTFQRQSAKDFSRQTGLAAASSLLAIWISSQRFYNFINCLEFDVCASSSAMTFWILRIPLAESFAARNSRMAPPLAES